MDEAIQTRRGWNQGGFQFSLRSLFFVTFVAALCSALVRASVMLGIIFVPLFALALVRTMRAVSANSLTEPDHGEARGLFSTFCQSTFLIFSLIVVSVATMFAAGIASTLFVLGQVVRSCPPTYHFFRTCIVRGWRLTLAIWNRCDSLASFLQIGRAFCSVRDRAIWGTEYLARLDRRLLSQFCLTAKCEKRGLQAVDQRVGALSDCAGSPST